MKGKVGRRRYRDDDDIEALHGLHEEPKDDNSDRGEYDDDWEDVEEE